VTSLDAADLVVIAGRTLGIGTEAALAQMDIAAAEDALAEAWPLAEARPPGRRPGTAIGDRDTVAAAGVGLVRALMRRRPFPGHGQQVAVAAGLMFLSLNGWQADLNPAETAAVVVEALGSGQLTPDDAAAWLAPRLTQVQRQAHRRIPRRAQVPRRRLVPRPSLGRPRSLPRVCVPARRAVAGALLTVAVGGVTVLAAACSRGPYLPDASSPGAAAATQRHQTPGSSRPADLAYADCMRSHGIENFPYPSPSGLAVIAPGAGIDLTSLQFRTAETTCHQLTPTATVRLVLAVAKRLSY
jgi:hypothetical protein